MVALVGINAASGAPISKTSNAGIVIADTEALWFMGK